MNESRVGKVRAFFVATLISASAFAQAPIPSAATLPPATPAAATPAAEPPAAAAPAPAPIAPAPLAPPPSEFPPISVGVWTRAAVAIQGSDPEKLDDIGFDTQFAEVNFSGQVHKHARV